MAQHTLLIRALLIFVTCAYVTSEHDHHDDHWCHDHVEAIDPFQEVTSYMNITTPYLSYDDVDALIDMVFHRVECDKFEESLGNTSQITCDTCLNASNIYQVLELGPSDTLNSENFEMASTIITVFAYQIADKCSNVPEWDTVTYEDFVEELMHFHDHGEGMHDNHDDDHNNDHDTDHDDDHDADHHDDHDADHHDDHDDDHHDDHDDDHHDDHEDDHDDDHDDDDDDDDEHATDGAATFFTFHQLEYLLAEINKTYRPGQYGVEDPDVPTICANENQEHFRSRDIMLSTPLEHPDEGVQESEIAAMSGNIIARILQGHCIKSDRTAKDGLPDESDFLKSVFAEYGDNNTCVIGEQGYEQILTLLTVGSGDEEEDEHDHGDHVVSKRDVTSVDMHMRVKREDDDHDHGESFLPNVGELCMTGSDILDTFYLSTHDVHISGDDFMRLCPALLQQSIQGCRHSDDHDDHDDHKPTNAEKYGYGTLAAFIVSACAAFGLILVKARHSPAYAYVMSVMLGLAFGSLVGDALLHLIPHAIGLHNHEDDGHDHGEEDGFTIEPYVFKMLAACGSAWGFFIMQMLLQSFSGSEGHGHSHSIQQPEKHTKRQHSNNKGKDGKSYDLNGHDNSAYYDKEDLARTSSIETTNTHVCRHSRSDSIRLSMSEAAPVEVSTTPSSVAWMVSIGDGIHNFADGLAMGAAFAQDWRSGVSTSLAVFCHELPHEFGDTSLLLSCGWSVKRVALFQLVSAATCFVGLYVGISVSENQYVREWIFIVTAGMFLYISLSDVVPELLVMFRVDPSPWRIFFGCHGGILLGFGLMLIIAIFEEHIAI